MGEGLNHVDRAPVHRLPSINEILREALQAADPELTEDQVRHGASVVAPRLHSETTRPEDIQAIVSICADYERALARAEGPSPAEPTLRDLEATQKLGGYLRGEVESCRQVLFSSADVPFRTLTAAAEWARSESDSHSLASPQREAMEEQFRAIDQPGFPVRVRAEWRHVQLSPSDETTLPDAPTPADFAAVMGAPRWLFPAGCSVSLGHLADVQQRLCHQVGVAEWEIARFVLLDLPPAVRRWQARLPDVGLLLGGTEAPPWFTVEIRDPRFSYVEIRALFGSLVRDGLIVSATSSADQREKLERLRQFVIERRDRPWPPGAWIDIVRDWNEANPDEHYTLRAIQRAYSKVCKLHGEEKAPASCAAVDADRIRLSDPLR